MKLPAYYRKWPETGPEPEWPNVELGPKYQVPIEEIVKKSLYPDIDTEITLAGKTYFEVFDILCSHINNLKSVLRDYIMHPLIEVSTDNNTIPMELIIDEDLNDLSDLKLSKGQRKLIRLIVGDQGTCVLSIKSSGKIHVLEPKNVVIVTK